MRRIDMIGRQFGDLTVIGQGDPYIKPGSGRHMLTYLCQCKCGNQVTVRGEYLRSGHTTSCGCNAFRIDHTGQRFGRLIAIQHIGDRYLCKCDCGNQVMVKTYNLMNGTTKSCGCYQKDRASEASLIDLTGRRYGMLTVICRVENSRYNHVQYKCKCDCGGECVVDAGNLQKGITASCGCIKSRGESAINSWLVQHHINFRAQYSHDEIIYSTGRRPFFDFAIFDSDDNLLCLIEYNGVQHYQSGYGWNDEKNHSDTVRRDNEKREQFASLGIRLVEIPYWDYKNLDSILSELMSQILSE